MALLEAESPSAPMSLPQTKGDILNMRALEEVTLDYHILDHRTMITPAELFQAGIDILALHRLQTRETKNVVREHLPGSNVFSPRADHGYFSNESPYNVQVLKELDFGLRLPGFDVRRAHEFIDDLIASISEVSGIYVSRSGTCPYAKALDNIHIQGLQVPAIDIKIAKGPQRHNATAFFRILNAIALHLGKEGVETDLAQVYGTDFALRVTTTILPHISGDWEKEYYIGDIQTWARIGRADNSGILPAKLFLKEGRAEQQLAYLG